MTPTPRDAVIAQAIAALEKMLRLFGRPRKGEYVDGGASYKLAVETVAEAQAALASLRSLAPAPADQSDAGRNAVASGGSDMVASNDTSDASGIYRPTADISGRPMPVYEGLANGLESEIALLFGDAMSVRCEPTSYARRCIALVRAHDAGQHAPAPNPPLSDRDMALGAMREARESIEALCRDGNDTYARRIRLESKLALAAVAAAIAKLEGDRL
jgi:hypothetical protein